MAYTKEQGKYSIFQNNSCYCLSGGRLDRRFNFIEFQYNSCYCLSRFTVRRIRRILISIQLLLLFIPEREIRQYNNALFQYNSCYCLSSEVHPSGFPEKISIQLLLLFILYTGWNGVVWKPFQYNSCYCLSPWAELPECNYSNFNTTLVTVYLYLILVSLDFFCDFNTTLVTVYLKGLARYDQTS